MRHFLLVLGILISSISSFAQNYGNEWIDYAADRRYLKFNVAQNGIVRIDQSALSFALQTLNPAVSISSIDPRSIQVFAFGEEQFIHIEGESDGNFNSTDYIELFCNANDGRADASMYPSGEHTNPNYSLYSDTVAYFLTWLTDGSFSTKRYNTVSYTGAAVSPMPYMLIKRIRNFTTQYNDGENIGSGVTNALYHGGKGWVSRLFGYNGNKTSLLGDVKFSTRNAFVGIGAPDIRIEAGVVGMNQGAGGDDAHHVRFRYKVSGTYTEFASNFLESYAFVEVDHDLDLALLPANDISIDAYAGLSGSLNQTSSDYCALSYLACTYPHELDVTGEGLTSMEFYCPQSNTEYHFSLSNWGTQATSFLYDPSLGRRYETVSASSTIKTNVAAGNERRLFLQRESEILELAGTQLELVGDNGVFTNMYSIEKDSAFLMVTHPKLASSATTYENYRNNTTNGRVVRFDIRELYDQFSYGIPLHPQAIRGMCDFTLNEWSTPPKYLLLLGKAIQESEHRQSATNRTQALVPTMGSPPSDNLLSMGLSNKAYAAAIATGRIAAINNSTVNAYLTKLIEAETSQREIVSEYTIGKKQWQKHVLHFAGGNNAEENAQFRGYLNGYKTSIEGSNYAGKTFLFSKTTGSVIEQLNLDTIRDLLRDGVSIMTFFGHGTTTGFDLNVDSPTEWDNAGKYPVVMANSCYSGNIHLPVSTVQSISEEYVLLPNLGAIAFLATPGLGDPRYLDNYTGRLHQHISDLDYGKSLAQQMRLTAESTVPNTADNNVELAYIGMGLEMTLHGDPAYKINPHDKSEITINDPIQGPLIRFEPEVVTTDVDSFDVYVNVFNLGKSVNDPISIQATRAFPTGKPQEIQYQSLSQLNYAGEVQFRFGIDQITDVGQNELTIKIDLPGDSIAEFDNYTNNEIGNMTFEIIDGDISPVYPYNFAVVPAFELTLHANTGYPFAPSREYTFQIDTVDTYDSPFFGQSGSNQVTQSGAVVKWNPNLQTKGFADSTVFFWRVAPSDDLSKWREFSFQVIDDKHGWGQDHFYQFKNNDFDFINHNRSNRKFAFQEASRDLFVNVVGSSQTQAEHDANRFELDGQGVPLGERGVEPGGQAAMAIVVIDTVNLAPWGCYGYEKGQFYNQDRQFGNSNNYLDDAADNRARPEYFFSFEIRSAAQMDSMVSMITNKVPDGYYILAYTLRYADFQDTTKWKPNHYAAFEALGADSIRYVENRHPYLFFTRKGSPASSKELLGKDPRDILSWSTKIFSTVKQGSIEGPSAGPAMVWESFHLKSRKLEPQGDEILSDVISTDIANTEKTEVSLTSSGIETINSINADSVLQVRLRYNTTDNENGTPSQLASWHLLYEPAPDAAINPVEGLAFRKTKVSAGEDFHFGSAVENISAYDFEALIVTYRVIDSDGNTIQQDTLEYTSLASSQVVFDSVKIETSTLNGRYSLWMEVNPVGPLWHKEEHSFNNQAYRTLTVTADKNNPLLDVTFDGVHILNGDIVSPSPEIVMELKDDNTYLLIDDTSSFDVFVAYPNQNPKRVPFVQAGQEIMTFEPAVKSQNKARVIYRPQNLEDGTYSLSVNGRDASGNASGKEAYKTDFQVINESMVTQVMNYPNPFTTSTRFVFTLTGGQIPDVFTIQIVSITGKVVREITKEELGPMNIGRNISEYAWDGTDEFGDRLANGVYMYRAIMKIDGEHIDRLDSGADQYFTKEFGKMYLFR